jgi:tetratricopeptide (TPR) repeat protein
MGWDELAAREQRRYADGMARLDPEQLVRVGNAAYGAGLALLMQGRTDEAREWLDRAAERWRESWEHATPTSWGRPIGVIKAALIARRDEAAAGSADWALELGSEDAESPIGRYAATLALLVLGRWDDASRVAATLQGRDDFPAAVSDVLAAIALGDAAACGDAVEAVLESFETRDEYLEDVPVADTVLVLAELAARRGIPMTLRASALLPAGYSPAAAGSR